MRFSATRSRQPAASAEGNSCSSVDTTSAMDAPMLTSGFECSRGGRRKPPSFLLYLIVLHSNVLCYLTIYYNTLQYITIHYNTLQCITQYIVTHRFVLHWQFLRAVRRAARCNTIHYNTFCLLQCNTTHHMDWRFHVTQKNT